MDIQNLSSPALRRRRRRIVRDLPPIEQVLRGTLVETYKRCGRQNCHCVDGPGHGPKRYLSVSQPGTGGRQRRDYGPAGPRRSIRRGPMMMNSKIADQHLARQACIYIRQSTMGQVRFHQESTERQYNLKSKAESLGWKDDQIRILDRDLGQSGSAATNREDFKALVGEVAMGRVGAIFSLEASRLARSNQDWHRLLELCAITSTL